MPRVPRLPFLGDPLRRSRPTDLDSITTVAHEAEPQRRGSRPRASRRSGTRRVRSTAAASTRRSRSASAATAQVILDRAIGHARGNGPADDATAKVSRHHRDAVLRLLDLEGDHRVRGPQAHERGLLSLDDRSPSTSPATRSIARAGSRSPTSSPIAPAFRTCPPTHSTRRIDDHDTLRVLCDAKPYVARQASGLPRGRPAASSSARSSTAVTGRDIRTVLAEEFLDPLGFRWMNYGVAAADVGEVATNYITGPHGAAAFQPAHPRARPSAGPVVELTNDPRFLRGDRPGREHRHERQRALALLRDDAPRRRARRRPGDRARDDRAALAEQSHLELDLSLGFPTRFSLGLMLGAKLFSLYGRDTQHAFGHLGFTNMLAWADPERGLSAAPDNNGKPIIYPELPLPRHDAADHLGGSEALRAKCCRHERRLHPARHERKHPAAPARHAPAPAAGARARARTHARTRARARAGARRLRAGAGARAGARTGAGARRAANRAGDLIREPEPEPEPVAPPTGPAISFERQEPEPEPAAPPTGPAISFEQPEPEPETTLEPEPEPAPPAAASDADTQMVADMLRGYAEDVTSLSARLDRFGSNAPAARTSHASRRPRSPHSKRAAGSRRRPRLSQLQTAQWPTAHEQAGIGRGARRCQCASQRRALGSVRSPAPPGQQARCMRRISDWVSASSRRDGGDVLADAVFVSHGLGGVLPTRPIDMT